MKKSIKFLVIAVFALIAFVSCSEKGAEPENPQQTPPTPSITIPSTENVTPSFTDEGGSATVAFTTNADWSAKVVESGATWCTVSPVSGGAGSHTLSIKVKKNDIDSGRKATVQIMAGTATKNINVSQSGKVSAEFKISQTEVEVGSDKSSFELTITSSIGYEIKPEADWIKQISVTGGNGVYVHAFEVAENSSADARDGVIVVCNEEQTCIPVKVKQKGAQPEWAEREFFHKSLVMRFTADWCGYCPMMATALDNAKKQLSGNLEVLSIHGDGGLTSIVSQQLTQLYKVYDFPTAIVDDRVQITNYSQISTTTSKIIEAVRGTETKFETVSGASWESSVADNKISLNLKVYLKKTGYYKVTALLVEDNIIAYQEGASDSYNHKDVVRGAFSKYDGEPMTITKDATIREFNYYLDIPKGCKTENLRVVVYIHQRQSDASYYINNATSAAVGTKQPLIVISDNSGSVDGIVPGDKITF